MIKSKEPLRLNVLVEMAVGDYEFQELLMHSPLAALREYNRQMAEELNPLCNLSRFEMELLSRIAGTTGDFKQFCRLVLEERERVEEPKPRTEVRSRINEERLTLRSA